MRSEIEGRTQFLTNAERKSFSITVTQSLLDSSFEAGGREIAKGMFPSTGTFPQLRTSLAENRFILYSPPTAGDSSIRNFRGFN